MYHPFILLGRYMQWASSLMKPEELRIAEESSVLHDYDLLVFISEV